jgi:hypothetical protein
VTSHADDLDSTTKQGEELGPKPCTLAFVPIDDGIHPLACFRVEFEADHQRCRRNRVLIRASTSFLGTVFTLLSRTSQARRSSSWSHPVSAAAS